MNKNILILPVLLFSLFGLSGFTQNAIRIVKKDKYTYEVFCEITFPNNCVDKLYDFCWDINSIVRIVAEEPVIVGFFELNSIQTISYDYQFLFMRYYSEYERIKSPNDKIIQFKLTKSECSIPFVPNLKNGYGTYTIKSANNKTTMQYYQYAKTDGVLRDFYFDYLKKNIEGFFISFESEFKKSLMNANN